MDKGTCRSCGAEILWAITENARRIPLDATSERRFTMVSVTPLGEPVVRQVDTYATHFSTCPNADEHRRPR